MVEGTKGTISSVLLKRQRKKTRPRSRKAISLLLNHNLRRRGRHHDQPAARGPIYFGHFAYGTARVVREPLTDDLRLEIQYFQVYTHNGDGLIACRHHCQTTWGIASTAGSTCARCATWLLSWTPSPPATTSTASSSLPLDTLLYQLQVMLARYRIGDGTGGGATYVGPANNCSQDSNQALYAALQQLRRATESMPDPEAWLKAHPDQAAQAKQLEQIGRSLKRDLLPWGTARADWKEHETILGSSLEDSPLKQLAMGLVSWRTMLPPHCQRPGGGVLFAAGGNGAGDAHQPGGRALIPP